MLRFVLLRRGVYTGGGFSSLIPGVTLDYSFLFKAVGIVFRECFEAVLIYGIMTSFVRKLPGEHRRELKASRFGLFLGVLASIVLALGMVGASALISDELFSHIQLFVLFAGSFFMLYMVFWMSRHAATQKKELEAGLSKALQERGLWSFIGVIFVAVFREGVEVVVYLYSLSMEHPNATGWTAIISSTVIGMTLAFGVFRLISWGAHWMSFRRVFFITGAWLLLSSSSLLATAIDQLYSLGYLNSLSSPVFSLNLSSIKMAGWLESLVGFRFQPTLLHLAAFLAFWVLIVYKDPLRVRVRR